MIDDAKARKIAAMTYLQVTRMAPGAKQTQAGLVRSDGVNAAAAYLAERHDTSAGWAEYAKSLIEWADTKEGAQFFHPIHLGEPDLTKLSAEQLLHHANTRKKLK